MGFNVGGVGLMVWTQRIDRVGKMEMKVVSPPGTHDPEIRTRGATYPLFTPFPAHRFLEPSIKTSNRNHADAFCGDRNCRKERLRSCTGDVIAWGIMVCAWCDGHYSRWLVCNIISSCGPHCTLRAHADRMPAN